jgi:ligand-binding sensor domain-containing protein
MKQKYKYRFGIASLITIFWMALGFSQGMNYEQFTEADGLPSMQTYEMVQDSNGILWIGTENGLVSYDGESFKRFSHPQLVNNDIIEIALDKNGVIYFLNLSNQIAYVKSDTVQIMNTEFIEGRIRNLVTTKQKNYILFNPNVDSLSGVMQFTLLNNGDFIFEKLPDQRFIYKNSNNSVQLHPNSSRLIYEKSNIYTTPDSLIYFIENYIFLEIDSSLFRATEPKKFERLKKYQEKYFVFYDKGVMIFDTESKEQLTLFNDITINTVFKDKEDNLWFSTRRDGLFKVPSTNFKDQSNHTVLIRGKGINDIIQDENGNKYVGTTSGEVIIYSRENKILRNVKISRISRPVSFLKSRNKFFGLSIKNICSIDTETKNIVGLKDYAMNIKSLVLYNDLFYVGTRSGILDLNPKEYQYPEPIKGKYLKDRWISSLFLNEQDSILYIGTLKGIYKSKLNDDLNPIRLGDAKDYVVSSIQGDNQNSIWIGTHNSGVLRLKDDQVVEKYNVSNGLESNKINNIRLSGKSLVVSTDEGVNIVNLESGKIKTIREQLGSSSKDIVVCEVFDDEYWVGSNSGLTIIKTDQIEKLKNGKPTLSLKNMYANGVKLEYIENLQLDHTINTILINFNNISFNNYNKSIKYRIKENDTSWVQTTDPLIRLQSLKQGKYTIEAIGMNALDEGGNKVSMSFTINPPWWQTLWARIIGVLLIIGVVQVLVRIRSKRIRKEETTKREYLTQINNIKDQALQLQMNPHFIFNSLNAIQGFIGTDEEELAMNFLARFARLIRLIFEHSKGNSITFEEELEFMHLYLDLEKLRFKDKVNVSITVDSELQNIKDIIKVPPLLIQPIVENSFKHGLFHKKGKGNLMIDYSLKDDILKVVVQDDGIGRKEAEKITMKNSDIHTSSGIVTTQERIDLLNFDKKEKRNRIEIIDVYHEDGSANGTRTILELAV